MFDKILIYIAICIIAILIVPIILLGFGIIALLSVPCAIVAFFFPIISFIVLYFKKKLKDDKSDLF